MKNKTKAYAVFGILFIIFNVITFTVPVSKTSNFWIAYVFSIIAFVVQIGVYQFAFIDTDPLKSKFLGIPLIYIGIIYLIIQLITFAIFIAVPSIPSWVAVVVCTLILAIFVVCLIGAETAKKEISKVEEKVQSKVFFIKSLLVDIEAIAEKETDEEVKEKLSELAEKIRFSDPMSNETLADLEAEIADKIKELKIAENKSAIITVLDSLLTERNKKSKLLK